MSKFAKLFERNGRQVLVKKDTDSDDNPSVSFEFQSKSKTAIVTLHMGFKKGYEARDAAFDKVNEEIAFGIVERAPGADL